MKTKHNFYQMLIIRKKQGFTIAELVIVIGVIAIAVPAVFGIFFSVLRAKAKVQILQEVKRNGDSAINTMKHLIQNNAVAIYSDTSLTNEVCSTKGSLGTSSSASSPLYFKDSFGNYFYFGIDSNRIASNSAVSPPPLAYLINNKATVSNFILSCNRPANLDTYNALPVVSISFTLTKAGAAGRQEERTSLTYSRKIKLRN